MPATAPPAGAAAPPAPTIAATLLTPQNRIAREPLTPWAERLAGDLAEARATVRTTRQLAGRLGFIGNNAGLVAAHRGDMDAAWRITERHLVWHGRQARRSGDAGLTAFGVQPWINLGRLETLTGRWREALSRFAGLAAYDVADRLEMGCVRLTGSAWSSLMASREQFLDYLHTVYVSDSLRAMLMNRRWELVAPFAARFEDGPLRWICEEARVVAACGLGDFAAAAARARAAAREAGGWNRAVLRLRLAETHACAGQADRAAEVLAQIAGVVRQLAPEHRADPRLTPVTARLAAACREAGLDEDACAVARDVLEDARAQRDELIQIETLRLLAAAAPAPEREEWRRAAARAEEETEYARYRRGRAPPPSPAVERLYERLDEAYAS
jgi:hypothetical protein